MKQRPFQGVLNIIRFNWHFYILAGLVSIALVLSKNLFPQPVGVILLAGVAVATTTVFSSLLVSFYIYDISELYQFKWLGNSDENKILNINAGFDETTEIIKHKFRNADITICDFYDPGRHTEISIKRARRIYPPDPRVIFVQTAQLPFLDNTFDRSLAILSAHEIRDEKERVQFFKELTRITKSSGQICVTEHLRDLNNFFAYTIGFFHFHSKATWLHTFKQASLTVKQEIKTTPFITTFILEKNGNTL